MYSLTSSFSDDLCNAINIYFPAKSVKLHPTDKPWMSAEIKSLTLKRQRAYHSGSNDRWRLLRNKVRIAICKRKKEFFARKVMSLKTSDPRSWWSLVSKLAGKSSTDSELCYPDEHGNIISGKTLATRLNSYFISVTSDIQPLDTAAFLLSCHRRTNHQLLPPQLYVISYLVLVPTEPQGRMAFLRASPKICT